MSLKAILFDAYGTLLDVHTAIMRHQHHLGGAAMEISALWRQKQLEYTWTLSLAQRYRPFDEVTAAALDFALAQHGIDDTQLRRDLLAAYRHLAPYADVDPTLKALSKRGLRLGVLSNGTDEMLRTAFGAVQLDDLLNPLLSVEESRIYKPDPRVYAMAARHLGLSPGMIGFVSSNAWDAMGAASFGFRVYWLRRRKGPVEYDLTALATPIATLSEIASQF